MTTYRIVKILKAIQEEDKKKEKQNFMKKGAASICAECGKNTHTGYYPFWHKYRRELCEDCGKEYTEFLKKIGAWND